MDPISFARYGLAQATQRLEGPVARAARACSDPATDLTQGVSDVVQAKPQFRAAIKVEQIAQSMWRELLKVQSEGR